MKKVVMLQCGMIMLALVIFFTVWASAGFDDAIPAAYAPAFVAGCYVVVAMRSISTLVTVVSASSALLAVGICAFVVGLCHGVFTPIAFFSIFALFVVSFPMLFIYERMHRVSFRRRAIL